MIYILVLLIILLLSFRFELKTIKPSKRAFLFVFFVLVMVAGFRYRVGSDTLIYMDEYETRFSIIKDKYLFGWYWFMSLCKYLNLSFYVVQIIIALIINAGVFCFFRRYFPQYLFSGLLIYYVTLYPGWNFEVLRQAICVSLFFYSLQFLEAKKYLKYYIIVLVACTIHETSLLLLFVPIVMRIQISKKLLIVFASLFLIVALFAPYIQNVVMEYALILAPFQDKAAYYFRDVDTGASNNLFNYIFNIILNVGIPLFVIWRNCQLKNINNIVVSLVVLSFFTYALSLMLPMMYRLNYFFLLPNLMMFIYLFDNLAKKTLNRRFLYFSLLILFLIFKSRAYFVIDKGGTPVYVHYYPYYSILNEQRVPARENIDFNASY